MTTRWWAPDGAHLGPDEKDFELLIPVDDARHDLGAALLALHRVGAAACEEVALHAIPDEVSLVSALATARAAFAAPLVESVSKSIGEGPYAGLLVRDVIDDAESAALSVFRTLVSKGVPATVAVQRVGMVYGVPESDLGRYLSVAGELRVHPAALTDAADRALFGAVEKIATEEFEAKPEEFETVSKTRPDDQVVGRPKEVVQRPKEVVSRDDPDTPYYDARDAEGKFARGSVTGPPTVGRAPAKRVQRVQRVERVERVERAKPKGRLVPSRKVGRKVERKVERKMARDVARLSKSRDEMPEADKNRLISLDPVTWSDGDYLAPIEFPATQGPFQQLDQEIAIGMSTDEWAALQAHLGRDEQGRLAFRMGHVAQERDANTFGRTSDYDTDEHRKVLRKLASDALADAEEEFAGMDMHLPIAITVDDDEITNLDPEQIRDYISGRKFDAIANWLGEQGADPYTPENQQYILDAMRMMRSTRSPDNKGDVYHYIPRVSGNEVAPRISVVELVFEPGVMGRDDGRGKHTDYAFDSNQVMRIENGRPAVIYDPQIKAFRLRYFITPDVSKADDPTTPFFDNRDTRGRFAADTRREVVARPKEVVPREEQTVPTRSTPQRRVERVQRVERTQRATPIQPRKVSRKIGRKVKRNVRRQLAVNQRVQRLQRQRLAEPKPYDAPKRAAVPELVEGSPVYSVISHEQLLDVMRRHTKQTGDIAAPLTDTSLILELAGRVNDGPVAYSQMKEMNKKAVLENLYGTEYKTLQSKKGPFRLEEHATEDMEAFKILEHAEDLFAENPDVQQISIDYNMDGTITFRGNAIPAPPVVLIQLQEDLDWKTPMVLKPIGRTPLQDFVVDVYDEEAWNAVDEMRAIRGEMEGDPDYEWDQEDIMENTRVPIQVENPTVEHYMLMNKPATDDEV